MDDPPNVAINESLAAGFIFGERNADLFIASRNA